MGYWEYYERRPTKKVTGGIKTKKDHGAIGETWWSKRWIHVLESFDMGTRLSRGRSYARQGQVLSIDVEPGIVKAKVQGSMPKPYNVKIRLQQLSAAEWEKVIEAMASQAIFAAMLLAGEMPKNIEEAFSAADLSLFPISLHDLDTDCSCPDYANPCKHIAAVYYLLAERFDEDPFLIFKLRGRTKEEIIAALREKRVASLPEDAVASAAQTGPIEAEPQLVLEEFLDTFWQAGEELDSFAVKLAPPEIDKAVLKRLGDAPFTVGKTNVATLLGKAYEGVDEAVWRKISS